MPIYDYVCPRCGPFTELRRISEYAEPAPCPGCAQQAPRVIAAPRLAVMSHENRAAWERNERAAHEPKTASHGHRCGPGCGHHAQSGKPRRPRPQRPWMLGH